MRLLGTHISNANEKQHDNNTHILKRKIKQ